MTYAMPADTTSPLVNLRSQTMILQIVSATLILVLIIAVLVLPIITGRDMAPPEKLNARIIALGVLAGLFHLFGAAPQARQTRAFASPVGSWVVRLSGIVTVFTS